MWVFFRLLRYSFLQIRINNNINSRRFLSFRLQLEMLNGYASIFSGCCLILYYILLIQKFWNDRRWMLPFYFYFFYYFTLSLECESIRGCLWHRTNATEQKQQQQPLLVANINMRMKYADVSHCEKCSHIFSMVRWSVWPVCSWKKSQGGGE